jgi:tetratricopeptide (TPR) repeat protein
MLRSKLITGMITGILLCLCSIAVAQPSWTINPFGKEKKPEKYEEKILPSEKTADKKFGFGRKIIQNTTSHYNFYFNANNKLNAVIERAKISNKDDYSKLLSFYPYSLDNTASQKTELDSVIYKATAGILLHDLRSEWVDNFYLLIGKSYFLRKEYDSAALTFQFINYNLFPRKKKDDDDTKVVGTNGAATGLGSVSIADKEKRNLLQKTFTIPPSRNDALIWLTRTFIEQGEYGDAAGMISILQEDKNLPARLKNDLAEVTAYWFYAQNNYDSSAVHLENALSNADTKEDKSRWEYLLAQMYEMSGKYDLASSYYLKAAKHTTDPVMDIYARLNDAKMMRNTGNFKELDNSIANLLRMAKRDRYEAYRDVIYYSAAQLTLQRPDTTGGIGFYGKSISYNIDAASGYRDKSYLQLANIAYVQRDYKSAKSYYDSLNLSGKDLGLDEKAIEERKEILSRLIPKILTIEREDSLQRLAAMSPAERDVFIKKMVKAYRKQNGLKEEEDFAGQTIITDFNSRNTAPPDLFGGPSATKGQFYFYDASQRSRGFNEFKTKWGKRDNVDNWRRKTASEALIGKNLNANVDIDATIPQDGKGLPTDKKVVEFNYETLLADVPLTTERIDTSNLNIATSMLAAAQIFQNELLDYRKAIDMYDEYLRRFPNNANVPDAYLGLSYCWSKLGDESKAALYKNTLTKNYASSTAARLATDPASVSPEKNNPVASSRYEGIYNMFLEGRFAEALDAKKQADSTYGKNYWTPQLLYIESVFYIKERQDSDAIASLKNIVTLYPNSPLKEKAQTMIDVLGRRAEIENYLTNLQVTRAEDDKVIVNDAKPTVAPAPAIKPADVVKTAPVIKKVVDTIKAPASLTNKSFTLRPEQAHYVAMILDKVDGVYVTEARNAFIRFNKGSMETLPVVITKDAIDGEKALLLFTPFADAGAALKYFDRIKKAAPSEISWLQPAKYSFIIISDENLQLLKTNKDLAAYKQLLNTNFGNKF